MPVELQIPDIVWRRYAAYQDACAETIAAPQCDRCGSAVISGPSPTRYGGTFCSAECAFYYIPGRTTEQNGPSRPADEANDTVPGSIFVAAGACGCSSPSLLLPHAPAGPVRAK